MTPTVEQIEEWKLKAEKWDALGKKIAECYMIEDPDNEGEYIENSDPSIGLDTIGELAAFAFGWA